MFRNQVKKETKKNKEFNSEKLNKLYWLIWIAIGMLVVVLVFYFTNFNNGFSPDQGDWGTFGDFVGGTLNPIFAFFSLMAIIYTIKIQTQELENSRQELEATREELSRSARAQEEQSKSLELQNLATKKQSFENTFFKLFDLFNLTKNTISLNVKLISSFSSSSKFNYKINEYSEVFGKNLEIDNGTYNRTEAIKNYLYILKDGYNKNYDSFNKKYESATGAYFGQIYQILKFIDNSNINDKQRYVNIYRAQFTKEELEFLFYHCLGEIGKTKFKPLVEKFEFFEHVIHTDDIDKPLREYDIKAFGKNQILIEKYNS